MTMETADALAAGLDAMGGRGRQVIAMRFLEGRDRASCASFLGISPDAFDVLLWRALGDLDRALRQPDALPLAEPIPFQEEQALAWALGAALSREDPPGQHEGELGRRLELGAAVKASAEPLRGQLLPPPGPPPSRRERAVLAARRLIWLLLVVAAAVLYSRWSGR
jgi:hypothetical protein